MLFHLKTELSYCGLGRVFSLIWPHKEPFSFVLLEGHAPAVITIENASMAVYESHQDIWEQHREDE